MRRSRLTAAALLLAVALAGCTDDPKPRFADPTTPSPDMSPASSPAKALAQPTTQPVEDETAKAFIRRWQTAASRMQVTGNTTGYLSFSHDCKTCQRFADTIQSIYQSGATVTSSTPIMTRLKSVGAEGSTQIFTYTLDSDIAVVRSANGEVQQRYLGGIERFKVQIQRRGGQWYVLSEDKL